MNLTDSPKNEERVFLHDISSPLTIAMGMTETSLELLKDGNSNAKSIEFLEKSLAALKRMADLLQKRRDRVKELEATQKK